MSNNTSAISLQTFYPDNLNITAVEQEEQVITIHMKSKTKECTCPSCGSTSHTFYATHHKKVQDLPILGKRVILDIILYEFKCDNKECKAISFTEPCDEFLNDYYYMTNRLVDLVCSLALETSCESSARILNSMNIKISGDTVIRTLIKRYDRQDAPVCGSVVGVDDFAFKKRHKYGTIIVDEETHKTVAVLDGRDGQTLKEWLKNNKQVKTVTRDRASAYAKAIEDILPDCMQIADRFHLHQNLMDAINKVIKKEIPATTAIIPEKENTILPTTDNAIEKACKKIVSIVDNLTDAEKKRAQLIREIQEMGKICKNKAEIGRKFNLDSRTVNKYLEGDPDILCRSNKSSSLEQYKDYIVHSISEGKTQSEVSIQVKKLGAVCSTGSIRMYVSSVVKQYQLNANKYVSSPICCVSNEKTSAEYITRKGIFNYFWMNGD